jgi:hypothetical protein
MSFKEKYLKYKNKYLDLKNQIAGAEKNFRFNEKVRVYETDSADSYDRSYGGNLTIKTLTGRSYNVNASDFNTIADLKQNLSEKLGFSVDQQRLIFGGKQLEDDRTLNDYNLKNGCTVHLILRIR